ncbi:MAG: four helix bundle protein [Candidatus Diapherotrites archaeon]
MQDFKRLEVWKRAHNFVLDIYKATEFFPKSEKFGMISQIRRASASIVANICEGCGRESKREFQRFLFISLGSAKETEGFLLLAEDLGYCKEKRLIEELQIISRMLSGLIKSLNQNS